MQLGMRYDTDSCSLIPCDIKFNSKTGYWYRPETFDHGMIKDSKKHYSALQHVKGSVVLDLGANCGGFTKMAIDAEAKMVVALEPCPYNFQILCLGICFTFHALPRSCMATSIASEINVIMLLPAKKNFIS